MKPVFIKVKDFRININDIAGYKFQTFEEPRNFEGVLVIELRTRKEPINIMGGKTLLGQLDKKIEEALKC